MTDKVQKIREEVVRLRNLHQMKYQQIDTNDNMCLVECGKRNLCNELLSFIDSMQEEPKFKIGQTITDPEDKTFTFHINRIENGKYIESDDAWVLIKDADEEYELVEEPVSKVWHDMVEEAENGRNIIIIDQKDFYGAVLRKGGTQLKNHNKERYVKWAYIDDIINVTNKEEPVSEDLEQAIDTFLATYFGSEKEKQEWPFLKKMAIYFAEWQKQKDSIPVSEDLKEEVIKKVLYFSENFHEAPWAIDSTGAVMPIWYAKFGANWQKQKMMKDAVEAAVNTYEEIGGKGYVEFVANVPVSQYKGEHGVKIIIIKEK